ncbi:MAG: hypothetical protein M3O74_22530 [Pseudomonadota bacterium]|jgi:hypothetical protein|uniref:Uncharacterized protein n=1 Tax=Caballeronia sordidicola TaxID=196367 RepID=A0A242M4S9_CABSO|nr:MULTISPECIES: hypothetical protein [Burkholderiaceae]AMM17688.1 hypothetical protein AX768_26320 [Burkholderia sp. PAMC 28687]MDP9157016.1 hypothetical protein [Pseudomonadota bacterium]OTP66031.1 hypothetical protein PAMC26510_36470 [Caballeronia sordidicola]
MNRSIVEGLLAEHGEGKFVLSHRIHGNDFEVMVSLLQNSGNTFVRNYCARAPILSGINGLGDAAAQTFGAAHATIKEDLLNKPAGVSLFEHVSDPAKRRGFIRPFD